MSGSKKRYTQADIRAMEEIKYKLTSKLSNDFNTATAKPKTDLTECKKKLGKELTQKIESAILKSFGKEYGLEKVPVCKIGASKYDTTEKMVHLGFYADIPQDEIKKIQAIIDKATKDYESKRATVEKWEMEALQYIAARKGEDGSERFPAIPKI